LEREGARGGVKWEWAAARCRERIYFNSGRVFLIVFIQLVKQLNQTGQMTESHRMIPAHKTRNESSRETSVIFSLPASFASSPTPTPSSPLFQVMRHVARQWTSSQWWLRFITRGRAHKRTPHTAAKRRHRRCQRIIELHFSGPGNPPSRHLHRRHALRAVFSTFAPITRRLMCCT
jgi:hypothetical protein